MVEFETDIFRMKINDDLIKEIIVKKNQTLKLKDILETKQLSVEYKPGVKFYVLIEGEENASVSVEAKTAAASEEYSKYTSALALCSNNLYDAIVGNLFLKVNRPKVPTRFFEKREVALLWLKEKANKT